MKLSSLIRFGALVVLPAVTVRDMSGPFAFSIWGLSESIDDVNVTFKWGPDERLYPQESVEDNVDKDKSCVDQNWQLARTDTSDQCSDKPLFSPAGYYPYLGRGTGTVEVDTPNYHLSCNLTLVKDNGGSVWALGWGLTHDGDNEKMIVICRNETQGAQS